MADPAALTEVEVYTSAGVQSLVSPTSLSGEPVLNGFVLDLSAIWNPPF
jgi:hypothetical protein